MPELGRASSDPDATPSISNVWAFTVPRTPNNRANTVKTRSFAMTASPSIEIDYITQSLVKRQLISKVFKRFSFL
jgi:hypothetical protein